ncbi:hypothetical protein D8S78_24325 [Natrialba swarupiae]|nr:hypothetical protein [Natrialba swarupiae]
MDEADLDGKTFTGEGDSITIDDVTDAEDTMTFATTRAGDYTIETSSPTLRTARRGTTLHSP